MQFGIERNRQLIIPLTAHDVREPHANGLPPDKEKYNRPMVYLLNTTDAKMTIKHSERRLEVFSDSSFAVNCDMRSFCGTVVKFGSTMLS